MDNAKWCRILLLLIYFFGTIDSLKIKGCNSNKINEIKVENGKSTIQFSDQEKISYDQPNANLKIWCDSDGMIDKCTLEHLSKKLRCEKSFPISCDGDDSEICQNENRIKFSSSSGSRCEFNFNQVQYTGITNKDIYSM